MIFHVKNKMISSRAIQLSSFINEIIKVFSMHHHKEMEEELKFFLNDNDAILPSEEMIRIDFIPDLKYSLENIKGDMIRFADYTAKISEHVQWHEADKVPEFFEGGYYFSEIIGDSGLVPSKNIRMGLYLQNQNVDYPSHAHEAEEFYLILSGNGSWQIGDSWFDAIPGRIFHHQPGESHRMITESEPLLGIWIWTGLIEGRYWFIGHED